MRVPVQLKSEYLCRLINIPTRKSKVLLDVNDAAPTSKRPHAASLMVRGTLFATLCTVSTVIQNGVHLLSTNLVSSFHRR